MTLLPLDLRVARVLSAREHPDADRLLLLDIDLGDEQRQVVAGVRAHYPPEELAGTHLIVVANLQPATIRGQVSQGMVLAAESDGTLGILVAPDSEPGTRIRTSAGTESGTGPVTITIDDFRRHEIVAGADGVTLDGLPLVGATVRVDRGVRGRVR